MSALQTPVAARIISLPPLKWIVSIWTPRVLADSTARATVFGMSCSLRSSQTLAPVDKTARTTSGPSAV